MDSELDNFLKRFGGPFNTEFEQESLNYEPQLMIGANGVGKKNNNWAIGADSVSVKGNEIKSGKGLNLSGALSGAMGMIGDATGGSSAAYLDKYSYDPKLQKQMAGMESMKDMAATALGPYGQMFRAVEKGAKNLGTAIAGEEGGDVAAGIVDPFSGQLETLRNDDATALEKIGVVAMPFMSGIIAGNARNRTKFNKVKEHNLEQTALEKSRLREIYNIEQGKESIAALKDLRKKQLGLT